MRLPPAQWRALLQDVASTETIAPRVHPRNTGCLGTICLYDSLSFPHNNRESRGASASQSFVFGCDGKRVFLGGHIAPHQYPYAIWYGLNLVRLQSHLGPSKIGHGPAGLV